MSTPAEDQPLPPLIAPRVQSGQATAPLVLVCVAALAWVLLPAQWAIWFSVAVAAWIAAYRLGCDKIGALVWCLAAGLCMWPLCIVIAGGTSDELARRPPIFLAGFPLLLAAALRFRWARGKAARGPNTAAIVVAAFTLIIPATVGAMISNTRENHADYQQTTDVVVGLHRLAAEVDALRAARGRLPKDEAEFIAWRGRPLPELGRYGRVSYSPAGDRVMLQSAVQDFWGHGWDLYGYMVICGDPRSRERIQVDLF